LKGNIEVNDNNISSSIIYPNVDIDETVIIGNHCIIYPNVKIKKNVKIGDFTIIGKKPEIGKNQMNLNDISNKTIVGENTIIGSQVIIYQGSIIGSDNFIADKSFLRENVYLNANVIIGTSCTISFNAKIGRGTKIMTGTNIAGNMVIGENCFIGALVCCVNDNTPLQPKKRDDMIAAKIDDNVIIGSNSTILPDLYIAKNTVLGAGSVLTKSIKKSNCKYFGIPAKEKKE